VRNELELAGGNDGGKLLPFTDETAGAQFRGLPQFASHGRTDAALFDDVLEAFDAGLGGLKLPVQQRGLALKLRTAHLVVLLFRFRLGFELADGERLGGGDRALLLRVRLGAEQVGLGNQLVPGELLDAARLCLGEFRGSLDFAQGCAGFINRQGVNA
jgi:hypothetical protein